jgi:hypothetical protein
VTTLTAAVLAAALAAPAAAGGAVTAVPASAIASTATFDCPAPKGWSAVAEDDGVTYLGPRDAHHVSAQVNVRYVPPGHVSYADADAYVARLTKKPALEVPGWKTYPVEKTSVAGRAARRVRLDSSEFVPPHSRFTKEVPMREEHVVVPASKGFYVIFYYAPKTIAAKNRAALSGVLKGFKPKL